LTYAQPLPNPRAGHCDQSGQCDTIGQSSPVTTAVYIPGCQSNDSGTTAHSSPSATSRATRCTGTPLTAAFHQRLASIGRSRQPAQSDHATLVEHQHSFPGRAFRMVICRRNRRATFLAIHFVPTAHLVCSGEASSDLSRPRQTFYARSPCHVPNPRYTVCSSI